MFFLLLNDFSSKEIWVNMVFTYKEQILTLIFKKTKVSLFSNIPVKKVSFKLAHAWSF